MARTIGRTPFQLEQVATVDLERSGPAHLVAIDAVGRASRSAVYGSGGATFLTLRLVRTAVQEAAARAAAKSSVVRTPSMAASGPTRM